ncbi:inactive rhomboid protein 1-like isoform X2 [Porites lutea]|uniref:inactive rhomboid protein 1-like isoform X2 n=1 Tax=Porites lutea TaxID=51062 RepID=UPI003CC66074
MERTPLLRHSANGRRYSQIPSNDEHSEYSVYSYCGDNFPQPEKRSSRSGTVDTQISVTSDESPPLRRCHRPLFIIVVTIVHCALIIYICVAGGIEDISFTPFVMSESVNTFGFIANNNNGSMHKEKVFRYSGVNGFIGPNSSFLVTVGAKFGPCMKKLEVIENRVKSIEENESDFVCCSYNGECGMMKNASCPGVVIDSENCSSNSVNCTHGITLRPCCLGLYCQCQVISQSKCSFQRGHWHKDKLLCKDVNCLEGICAMSKGKDKTSGHQWYRLITPIFLHLGIIHLVTNLFFQIPVGILIEREIGLGYFTIHWKLCAHWWFLVRTVRFTGSPSAHELSLQELSSKQLCKGDFYNTASHLIGWYVCFVLLGEEPQNILLVVPLCRLRAIQEGPFLPEYEF